MKEEITLSLDSYLSFRLEDETFAVNVGKVLEILEVPHLTKVPRSPEYLRGVINLRGTVLPVIDTRVKFGLSATRFTVDTCVVVLNINVENDKLVIGALVDAVQEVLEIGEDQIKPSPSLGSKYQSEFIRGMVKMEEQFIMLLNIDRVFSTDELTVVKESSGDLTH
ncbi:MAG: purine-binding chemotaxis protein CheW [Ferruginibacter sp.]|nr:purine-binding chemotaxis protein CheW [Cytophagales bacterium]